MKKQNEEFNCASGHLCRRSFLTILAKGTTFSAIMVQLPFLAGCSEQAIPAMGVRVGDISAGEDLFAYIQRVNQDFDQTLYRQLVGAANAFKEGDEIIGVAAAESNSRTRARSLLANTVIGDLTERPLYSDALYALLVANLDSAAQAKTNVWTLERLKEFSPTFPGNNKHIFFPHNISGRLTGLDIFFQIYVNCSSIKPIL